MVWRDAVDWYDEAIDFERFGDYEEAVQCYDRALELEFDPENTKIWKKKGLALAILGRYDEAVQCYEHILDIDRKMPKHGTIKALCFKNSTTMTRRSGVTTV